jgi:pyruvate formate lyase activating enzyme
MVSASDSTLAETAILAFLGNRKKVLDGVVISGGEPTIQPGLPEFLLKIKSLGYQIKLDTNGSNPQAIEKLVAASLLDYVALDLKADLMAWPEVISKTNPEKILQTLAFLRETGFPSEFRTTCVSPFVTSKTILSLAKLAQGKIAWYLQRYRPEQVLDPEYMGRFPDQPGDRELLAFQKIAETYLPCHIR